MTNTETGLLKTIATVSTGLRWPDYLRRWSWRWGFGRMRARVAPGLYQAGQPGRSAPVLVSCNYRMSFDYLRAALQGWDAWILVLDTKGINVWCAAGKGSFGTETLVRAIQAVRLREGLDHRRLILPQLAGPGVAAHAVEAQTGFQVVYGPIRSQDLPEYLKTGQLTPTMRQVTFTLSERLVIVPMEWRQTFLPLAIVGAILGFLFDWSFAWGWVLAAGLAPLAVAGLHHALPGRWLSIKGAVWGSIATLVYAMISPLEPRYIVPLMLIVAATSAYLGLNLTGATPYTPVNGVRREMRVTLPWIVTGALVGILGLITMRWIFKGGL